MSVDATNPGKGDPAGILRTAEERADKAATVRTAATTMARLAGESGNVWAGVAQVEFASSAARASTELEVLASRWEAEAAALSTYARAVQEIQDAQLPLRLRLEDAADDRRSLGLQYADAELESAIAYAPLAAEEATQRRNWLSWEINETDALLTRLQGDWDELVAQRQAADRACVDALSGAEVTGFSPALLAGNVTGATLLGLSVTNLLVLARNDPDALAPMTGNDPAATATWWDAMPEADRHRLIEAAPGVIGNLEGVLYADRDQANRIWLDQQLAQARNALDNAEQSPDFWQLLMNPRGTSDAQAFAIAEARQRLEGLEGVQRSLRTVDGAEPRYLISLTADTPPLAAVAIGNVDTADTVSYTVPGMSATTADMRGWAQSAENLLNRQAVVDPGRTHAVIAWMGYETPPVPVLQGGFDVLDTKLAEAGAVELNTALGGLSAVRPDAVTNIVAHSYGTTTTAIALSTPGSHVDAFVSLGSAGLPSDIDEARDLRADAVYAGQARSVMAIDPEPGDQWAWSGRLGNHPVDPAGPTFGAVTFGTDSGVGGSPVTDHGTATASGNGYLDLQTESLNNVANATTGHADRLTERLPSEPTMLQKALIEGASGGLY